MKMKSAAIGSLLIAFLVTGLTITAITGSAAFPRKPHKFWGTATLDGGVVPEGSLVTARVAGNVVAKAEVGAEGSYSLTVSSQYSRVNFYVKGKDTGIEHSITRGGITNLSLSITDEAPPEVTISSPPDGELLGESSVTVEAKVTDGIARYDELSVELNGTSVSLESDGTFTKEVSLTPGKNDLTVTAEDLVGRTSSKTVTVTSDTESPTLEITAAPSLVREKSATIEGKVIDDVASPEQLSVTLNDSSVDLDSEGNFSEEVSLVTGSNTFTITAKDQIDHTVEKSVKIVSDSTGPQVNIRSPVSGKVLKADTVTIKATVSDDVASYEEITVTLNEETVSLSADGTFEKEVSVGSGQNTFEVTAEDPAGNTGSAEVTVVKDTKAPTINISKPEEGYTTTDDTVTVSGTVNDDIASYDEITLTVKGNTVTVGSNGSFSTDVPLKKGTNSISVVATDGVGNSNSKTRTVKRTSAFPWLLVFGVAVVIAIVLAGIAIWRRRAGPSRGGM